MVDLPPLHDIDAQIAKLSAKREKLLVQMAEFNALPLDKRVAVTMHKLFCHENHTDGCRWYYEDKNQWRAGGTMDLWLRRARHYLESVALSGILMEADEHVKYLTIVSDSLTFVR